jgi:phosphopantothenoylcysteine synthetase/decarboxylase
VFVSLWYRSDPDSFSLATVFFATDALMPTPVHLLVTAGPTREKIDDVRDWGNIFSGKTGLDLALAFLDLGNVTLLTSNESHAREYDGYSGKAGMMGVETFRTHADLNALLEERMAGSGDSERVDVVAMTAAVADYTPAGAYRIVERKTDGTRETWVVENVSAGKVKSSYDEIAIRGTRTLKLVDRFRRDWAFGGTLIKFKLEVGLSNEELIAVASASRLASDADMIVANTLAMARPKDGSEGGAYMIDPAGPVWVGRKELAPRVKMWVQQRLAK